MSIAGRVTPGSRLGPYEITAPLGAGAMGEVYRARDTRLRRDVALKVLPADVSSDLARRARFEQEALAAAALNHPNILAVHDIGDDGGVLYIATELIDGETLQSKIEGAPIPVRTLLDVGVQIADGMASAHAARIVHRDLKPANVMVASDGRVKILDFGLAKHTGRTALIADETIMADQTEPGMIVGAVTYMSPEQARAKPTDYRSDQFSFGLILYEMATGRKAFAKDDSVQTMAAIIAEEPPPIEVRLPAPLRWIIDRCLAKDPAARYESSRDLFQELRSLRDHFSEVSTSVVELPAPTAVSHRSRWWQLPAAFVLGMAAILTVALYRAGPALPDQSAYRFTPFSFEPGGQSNAVWSPDGKAVAYAARQRSSAPFQVFLRYLDTPTPVPLTLLPDSAFPVAWSPDSKRVILLNVGATPTLSSIATVGGEPEPLMTILEHSQRRDPGAVAVSPDNKTVAMLRRRQNEPLQISISSPPGAPLVKYEPDPFATTGVYNRPRIGFSPDGKQILLLVNAGRHAEELWVLKYPPEGAASARQLLPHLQSYGGTPTFAWMPDSRHVVLSLQSTPDGTPQLWLADTIDGERHALTSGTTSKLNPSVAPDGTRLIFSEATGHFDVLSVDLASAAARTFIATQRNELMPAWAGTERALVYVTDRSGQNEIWLHRPDNPDRPVVTASDFPERTTQWFMGPTLSPRADRTIYVRIETGTSARLWISAVRGGAPVQLTDDSAAEFPGSWSPDGSWFVYTALRDGKASVMKVRTTGQATPVLVKSGVSGNGVAAWSPAGNWIAVGNELISPDGKTSRSLGDRGTPHYTFSRDGTLVYGIRQDKDRQVLFSVHVETGVERTVGEVSNDFRPGSSPESGHSFQPCSRRPELRLWERSVHQQSLAA